MAVNFIASGKKTYVENSVDGTRTKKLNPGVYTIEFSREEGFHLLHIQEKYVLPEKMYGNYEEASKRIVHTHQTKKGNTGILLTGLKGTGKSLFVKMLGNIMIEKGVPVIQINKAYEGDDLFNFVENLGNCVLLFDEFGKNYSPYNSNNAPTQVSLLSLFDGMSNSKRMHLFTENSTNEISPFLINRPGRIHYHFKYNRLPENIIREFCYVSEVPEDVTEEMVQLSNKIKVLSFDVVKCIVDEWKMYGGKLVDHLEHLNITLLDEKQNLKPKLISYFIDGKKEADITGVTCQLSHDLIYIDDSRTSDESINDRANLSDIEKIENNIYTIKTQNKAIIKVLIQEPLNN